MRISIIDCPSRDFKDKQPQGDGYKNFIKNYAQTTLAKVKEGGEGVEMLSPFAPKEYDQFLKKELSKEQFLGAVERRIAADGNDGRGNFADIMKNVMGEKAKRYKRFFGSTNAGNI